MGRTFESCMWIPAGTRSPVGLVSEGSSGKFHLHDNGSLGAALTIR